MNKKPSPKPSEILNGLRANLTDPAAVSIAFAGLELSPGQKRLARAICSTELRHRQLVVKVMRGGGKTGTAATAFATALRNDPTRRIFTLSGSYWQALRLYGRFQSLITNPQFMPPNWLDGPPTRYLTKLKQGGFLEILTTSPTRARAGHVDWLCIDEAVLVPARIRDAVWPVVRTSKQPKRLVMSTASPEVSQEWFISLWQNADKAQFQQFEWPLEECVWITQSGDMDQISAAVAAGLLDSQTFKTEYLGEIAERSGRVWDTALIDGHQEGKPRAVIDPTKTEQYPLPAAPPLTAWSVGLDWGFIHPTVITVWEKQGETVYARDCRIREKTALSEIMEEIREDFRAYTVYADSSGMHENDQLRRLGLNVRPVIFSKEKDELIGHVRWRLEKGLLKIPDPNLDNRFFTLIQEMKAYTYDDKGKPRKINDDCVDSMLCGMHPFTHETPAWMFKVIGAKRQWQT